MVRQAGETSAGLYRQCVTDLGLYSYEGSLETCGIDDIPLLFSDALTKIACRQRPYPRCRRGEELSNRERGVRLTARWP